MYHVYTVNHEILLKKLDFYGVRGTFFKLVTSYLNNRYQRVVIRDKLSTQYLFLNNKIKNECYTDGQKNKY
jgi:hypothetical protein